MHLKKKTFREFLLVTIEPQYANQIDSLPSQSFRQFNLHNRLKTRPDTRQDSRGWLGRGSNAKTARNSEM